MLKSNLFVISLFLLIVCLLLPVQLYGIICDRSPNLTNCDERSSSSSTSNTETIDNSRSDNTETPLIIPDISPTDKDLRDSTAGRDLGTTDTDASNDNNNDDDNDDSKNSIDKNSDTGRENDKDSSDSEDGSSDSKTSLIPFP